MRMKILLIFQMGKRSSYAMNARWDIIADQRDMKEYRTKHFNSWEAAISKSQLEASTDLSYRFVQLDNNFRSEPLFMQNSAFARLELKVDHISFTYKVVF